MESANKTKDFVKLPELLAPAGSYAHLKAAVLAGADAVYIGGQMFSARAYAMNLEEDEIRDALHYTHFHGRRLYLTVNTLMKEEELNHELYGFLQPYYEAGLDGVIVQDLGTASFIHKNFPEMEVHASTQMTITHALGAIAAGEMGMTRVVPARELSLPELIAIKKQSGLEVEVFIHGALCYCYSGQCLLSSHYGGRSGNRGQCAQPCRLPYYLENGEKASYLSLRDLCSLHAIPSLVDAGIDSLKIEGRMKNIEYVAGVTAIYRKYLDLYARLKQEGHPGKYHVAREDEHDLEELYCRGGFTEGYLNRHNGSSMMAVHTQKNMGRKIGEIISVDSKRRRIQVRLFDVVHPKDILVIPVGEETETVLTVPSDCGQGRKITLNIPDISRIKKGMPVYRRRNQALISRINEDILGHPLKYPVDVSVNIRKGKATELTLTSKGVSITIEGPVASQAEKRAISKGDIEKQFKKTGETPFTLSRLDIKLEDDCFLPLSAIKQLRQEGYSALALGSDPLTNRGFFKGGSVKGSDPPLRGSDPPPRGSDPLEKIAIVYDADILSECLSLAFYTSICLPADSLSLDELRSWNRMIVESGKKPLLSLPAVMRKGRDDFELLCRDLFWDGIYVHNINEAAWLAGRKDYHGKRMASASFYQWNLESIRACTRTFGIDVFQLPVELGPAEWDSLMSAGIDSELFIYGRLPLMISAQCVKMTRGMCDHQRGIQWLTDPKGRKLPVTSHCAYCYNRIWSHEPVNLTKELSESFLADIPRVTFDFFQTDPGVPTELSESFTIKKV